jgi:Leucine-rich repeat (LRR) protein
LPAFADLPELTALDLSENSFRGDISELSLPPTIKVLNLDYNHFRGPISPTWFSNLSNLTHLRLSGNKLGCGIPLKCWHFLPHLEVVDTPLFSLLLLLAPPFFFGILFTISQNKTRCSQLLHTHTKKKELHMSKCSLEGGVPASIADATELKVLDLSSNDLEGDLPYSLTELHWLEVIHIQSRRFAHSLSLSLPRPIQALCVRDANFSVHIISCQRKRVFQVVHI